MRILYVVHKYDYGVPERGFSYEHWNFFHSLHHLGHDIVYFDLPTLMNRHGRSAMNRLLIDVAKAERPDLVFFVLHREELERRTVQRLTRRGTAPTLAWFTDDHWQFDCFSSLWAPQFGWVVTTSVDAVARYAEIGVSNVIASQWACNHFLYRKLDIPLKYEVTFVGLPHGNRRQVIASLRDSGITVSPWGLGWEGGRLDQEQMIEVFNASRINLNLSEASTVPPPGPPRWRKVVTRTIDRIPFGEELRTLRRRALPGSLFRGQENTTSADAIPGQIKGRVFEVTGCGGFLLSGSTADLSMYLEPGREVVSFENVDELVARARYFLDHEEDRCSIAAAGWRRTLSEHTWAHRFAEIFARIGLGNRADAWGFQPKPGNVLEIE